MTRRPARVTVAAVATTVLLLANVACGAGSDHAGTPASGAPATSAPAAKLAPPLASRLPSLPADEPVRLIALLAPGTATEPFRAQVETLGGRLLQRFTLIDAAEVVVPGRSVLPLAELPQVRGLELADSGAPPPR
jgi:hypothetical protein